MKLLFDVLHCLEKAMPVKNLYEKTEEYIHTHKASSSESSCVSIKSDRSMGIPPLLSDGADMAFKISICEMKEEDVHTHKAASPEPSCVSVNSKRFMGIPPLLSNEAVTSDPDSARKMSLYGKREEEEDVQKHKAASTESSCVSMKSDRSMVSPLEFSDGAVTSDPNSARKMSLYGKREEEEDVQKHKAASTESSCVSMKSDRSMVSPLEFSDGAVTSDPNSARKMSLYGKREEEEDVQKHKAASTESSCVSMKSDRSMVSPLEFSDGAVTSDPKVKRDDEIRSETSRLTCTDIDSQTLKMQRVKEQHKSNMKNKYERLFEGIKLEYNQTLLNKIYIELYIIEGESEGVNEKHEVLQIEKTQITQDTLICCNDIFKPLHQPGREEKDEIKTVLTKGIAGIGKTVSVQKLILDWAEGKTNQDVDFMFVLPFREMNLIKDRQYSLHRLLLDFHPELQDLDSKIYEECKVVFIFDGLDESKFALMFSDNERVCDVNESSSVAVLMSNLIRGELLPSALIWITSRPAAANQIPAEYINRVTEIQGFNEPQKEEYFRKRISDEHQASRIISHIRRLRSLHIMCHIPVFCWISATVLQNLLKQDDSAEIPQTLTEMYIHFLLTQINMKNQKYDERDPEKPLKSSRDVIVKLAELSYKELMKGNVLFYEEDLIESGIDVTAASVYSGICTEIFKEESVIHQRKIYCFIHLSFQEFLAAFFVFCSNGKNEEPPNSCQKGSLYDLLKPEVDKYLQSKNGHLDLFLRFLLGMSLESNQRLIKDLLTLTVNSSETINRITQYIQDIIKGDERLSVDRCINLFHCLLEMKDQTLYREIQEFVQSENLSVRKLSPSHCSTIAYMLQISEEVLDEFDLRKYNTSYEGRNRLIPAVVNCRKALLAGCNLTGQCCGSLSSCLQSSNSLRELDLSNNNLQDSGVKLLTDGLKSSHCQLSILGLAGCNLTGQCCESLCSSLQSSNSLRELDLSYNNLQDSGVKLLTDGLNSSHCQLNILRVTDCNLSDQCCENLSSSLQTNSSLKEMDLSNNDLQDSGVKLLSDGLKISHCQLKILRLSGCMVTEEGCCFLASALSLNPSHLRELDLSYNHPGQSLVKLLSDSNYRLDKLNLDHGGEIRIKPGLKKYARDLTLDLNTAHTQLALSEMNRTVEFVREKQPYPDNPDRFDKCYQVLCRESLSERCYWEAEWCGRTVYVSVAYKEISRKGRSDDCWFGFNDKSWSLNWFIDRFTVSHNNKITEISVPSHRSNRVGVYLNSSAGILSFYSVSDTHTLTHLHTFTSTFTEPLYAGFTVFYDSSVSLCEINH
ncbi:NACHT, LRR and PYD domains-containing protein 3-like isoform X2 [Carassius carassius]|uniref:NACHT, LRR and PYD domains-containing protein 3-like isoform X2 n=1 Tax=Carassius carassius TaxID=217509 RepID=UPI0028696B31|nr:NACHT, LRR and PYD domains-containing protein 3-like isoform X2 [Carassius carassius]